MSKSKNSRYLHKKAIKALQAEVKAVAVIAGRGWSKSTLVGADIYENVIQMPRSFGSIWGLTYNQILTKVLPSAVKEWNAAGLIQDRPIQPGHFIVGRKPPPYFDLPRNLPLKWENIITFMNGSAIELISVDRPDTTAGGSYDWMVFDEAVFFPKHIHDTKAIPALRGNVQFYGDCPRHGRRLYVSSQAWDPAGYWVEDQKWLADDNGELVYNEKGEKVLDPNFLFIHGTSWDNEVILTTETLKLWRKTLPSIVYQIEIEAKRMDKISNAFYEMFDTRKHCYIRSYEYDYNYEQNQFGVFTRKQDADRDEKLPLRLSFDFGTNFNSLLVGQFHPKLNELRIIREFFESSNQLIAKLVDPFCDFYENHANKYIELYGDPAGNKRLQMDERNLYELIIQRLMERGWRVNNMMMGRAYPLHRTRHQFINDALEESNAKMPKIRINMHSCKYLLTSIKNAPMGKEGTKDKSSERSGDQKTATHLSDAFDYLVWYGFHNTQRRNAHSSGGGARLGARII